MGKSLFLEGLKSAREIVSNKGLQYLDNLISELETEYKVETQVQDIKMETR